MGNLITIHILKYENKEIPVYFDKDLILNRLFETEGIVSLFKDYLYKNNIEISDKVKRTFIASETVSSAFIEGYETYIPPEYIVEGLIPSSFDERAIVSGYNASLLLDTLNSSVDVNSVLSVWKRLVKYKPFMLKTYRKAGVRVGNRFRTVHVAPNKKYVKDMLCSMFTTLDTMSFDWDTYDLLKCIVFHYIFTYIHPFMDGNGRCSRLFENYYLTQSTGIPYFCQISEIILRNKSKYYKSFNSGKVYNGTDLTGIDITDFINLNLYFISQGYISIFNEMKYSLNVPVVSFEHCVDLYDKFGCFDREKLLVYIDNIELYCQYLLNSVFVEKEFNAGLKYKVSDYDLFRKNTELKWKSGETIE